ncbi:MAG: hypothetical protein KME14_21950 [Tildeniella torsiva UHER 1998/13D]|nr:hypothetical protein [Tildeniella torsiva UHER 1998/13D]
MLFDYPFPANRRVHPHSDAPLKQILCFANFLRSRCTILGQWQSLLLGPFRWPQTPIEKDVPPSFTSRKGAIAHRFKPMFCKVICPALQSA